MSVERPFGPEGRDARLHGEIRQLYMWPLPARRQATAALVMIVAVAWIVAFVVRLAEGAWATAAVALLLALYVSPAAYLNYRYWRSGGYRD